MGLFWEPDSKGLEHHIALIIFLIHCLLLMNLQYLPVPSVMQEKTSRPDSQGSFCCVLSIYFFLSSVSLHSVHCSQVISLPIEKLF